MKTIVILFTLFALKSCGSTENISANTKPQDMTLSGKYTVTILDKNNIPHDLTIEFDEAEKKISGFSGCNSYFGSYSVNNDSLKIGPLASTRKYCEEDANNIESKFLQALEATNTFTVSGKNIQLHKGKDVLIEGVFDTEEKEQTKETTNSSYTITYNAFSRGFFKTLEFKDNKITFQNSRDEKPSIYKCTQVDLKKLKTQLDAITINALQKLEAPSKKHQFDGAPGATLTISFKGETHATNTFDHGNPPEQIKELVNLMLSFTESM